MNLSETFANNDIVQDRFGKKFDAIKNIKMTKITIKATPIVEIANKLGLDISYKDLGINGYIENNTIIVNNFDAPARQRYTIALFLSRKLQPELSDSDHVRFANDLLLPEKSLRLATSEYFENNIPKNLDSDKYREFTQHLAKIFITSTTALDLRLQQLNLVYN